MAKRKIQDRKLARRDPEEDDPPKKRAPINSAKAAENGGKIDLPAALTEKYGIKSIRFNAKGFPVWPKRGPKGPIVIQAECTIKYTGSRDADFTAADEKVRETNPDWEQPEDYTWHHHEDMKTMQCIPTDLHEAVRHSGGVSEWVHKQREAGHEGVKYDTPQAREVATGGASAGGGGSGR